MSRTVHAHEKGSTLGYKRWRRRNIVGPSPRDLRRQRPDDIEDGIHEWYWHRDAFGERMWYVSVPMFAQRMRGRRRREGVRFEDALVRACKARSRQLSRLYYTTKFSAQLNMRPGGPAAWLDDEVIARGRRVKCLACTTCWKVYPVSSSVYAGGMLTTCCAAPKRYTMQIGATISYTFGGDISGFTFKALPSKRVEVKW